MPTPKITIIPEGGLCNRIRAINAARLLCSQYHTTPKVAWVMNADLNCPFHKLFSTPKLNLKNYSPIYLPALISRLKRKSKLLFKICSSIEKLFGIQIIDSKELLTIDIEQLLPRIAGRRKTYLCAWFGFYGEDDFTGFSSSPAVENIIPTLPPSTIGIHIRRTDNTISIASSPIELFIEKIASYPTPTLFFLATDSLEVKSQLTTLFPGRIITLEGSLSRNSPQGMIHAAAELFTLSRCSALLASHWSSFSDAAAQIGNIPKIVIQKNTPTPNGTNNSLG